MLGGDAFPRNGFSCELRLGLIAALSQLRLAYERGDIAKDKSTIPIVFEGAHPSTLAEEDEGVADLLANLSRKTIPSATQLLRSVMDANELHSGHGSPTGSTHRYY